MHTSGRRLITRMFGDAAVRAMHGERFPAFARGLAAMVRATRASRLEDEAYRRMCDDFRKDPLFAAAWDGYDIATPLGSTTTSIESAAVGTFSYEALTLEIPDDDGHWLVIQVPDAPSSVRLRAKLSRD
jgi:hypothetical protein